MSAKRPGELTLGAFAAYIAGHEQVISCRIFLQVPPP
jgi:hypothetical protein